MTPRSHRRSGPVDPRLLRHVPALRPYLAALGALHVAGAVLTVLWAGLLAVVVAHVVVDGDDLPAVGDALAGLAAVGVARAGLAATVEALGRGASQRARAQLRHLGVTTVSRLGPAWATAQPPGRVATACGPGVEGLDAWVTRALPALVAAVVVPPVVGLQIAIADGWSALVLLALLPLVPVFMVLVGRSTRERLARRYAILATLSGRFLDLVQGLTTLRVYGRTTDQTSRLRAATDSYRRHTMAALRVGFLSGLVLDVLATLSIAVVAVEMGLRLDAGATSLTTALLVLLLAPELFAPLRAAGAQYHAAEEGRAAAGGVLDMVDELDELTAGAPRATVTTDPAPAGGMPAGAVSWRGVTVAHPGREQPALDRIDLDIVPGSVVVLEGPSGAGKSTLIATALGLVPPTDGNVVLGPGGDHPAWVPQRPRPTQDTVGAEVALGDPTATGTQIDAVLVACSAPAASTPLGEDGGAVSAGQRRRIALARALLRVRRRSAAGAIPLVLLDEPSEDLDAATEQIVSDVIGSLAAHATVVVATHSEALATLADRRIRLEDGHVTADRLVRTPRRHLGIPVVPATAEARRPVLAPTRPSGLSIRMPVSTSALLSSLRDRRRLVGAAVLSGTAGLSGLALTATSLWLICRAAGHPGVQALALAVVGVRTFALARALLRYVERLVSHDAALHLLAELRVELFTRLVPLVPYGLGTARRGRVLRTFVTDVENQQDGLVRTAIPWVGATLTALGATTLAAAVAPPAGVVVAAAAVLALVVAPGTARVLAGSGRDAAAVAGDRDAAALGLVEGLAELSVYDAVVPTLERIAELDRRHGAAQRRETRAAALATLVSGTALALALPAVVAVGVAAAASGAGSTLAVAILAACVITLADVAAPVGANSASWAAVLTSHARVQDLLARPVPVPPASPPTPVPSGRLGLVAEHLAVAPGPLSPTVLSDVCLDLRPGHVVAVTGPSGCGKSTLFGAVLRLTSTRHGRLFFRSDETETDVDQVDASALPPRVAGSLQGDHVFDASLGDNLRIVRPSATDGDLADAAARAGLASFVAGLPAGWATPAGPDGNALSGGQRQRLLLARAFLADPEILVVDEPTAHLDRGTADAVMRDLVRSTAGRTVLLSTHRRLPASTLADRVVLPAAPSDPSPSPDRPHECSGPCRTPTAGGRDGRRGGTWLNPEDPLSGRVSSDWSRPSSTRKVELRLQEDLSADARRST